MACKTQDGVSRPFSILLAIVACLLLFPGCKKQATVASLQSQGSEADTGTPLDSAGRAIDLATFTYTAGTGEGLNAKSIPTCPFPQHRRYPDVIIQPSHLDQEQMDSDVLGAYSDWKSNYVMAVDQNSAWPPMYRVSFGQADPGRSVSEGIGYGMLITVMMAAADPHAREYFDGLWRFSRLHPSNMDARLMAWQVPENNAGDAAAFDGDADMALALLLADQQWGSQGDIDYSDAARRVIKALRESAIGPDSKLPMLGDWVDPFGEDYNQSTVRSSDFMSASFKAFASVDDALTWQQVVDAVQSVTDELQQTYAPKTGLLPDFVVRPDQAGFQPASGGFLEGPHDGDYHYNAGRVPLRLGMDALLERDRVSRRQLRKIADFVASRVNDVGANGIGAGFSLDGKPYGDYFTTFFAAPFAVALMVAPEYQRQLNELYDAVATRRENYYEDSINLLSLLLLSGNFWWPGQNCSHT